MIPAMESSQLLYRSLDAAPIQNNNGGLGVVTSAVFLVGELAGTGLLAMPRAVMNTGKYIDTG